MKILVVDADKDSNKTIKDCIDLVDIESVFVDDFRHFKEWMSTDSSGYIYNIDIFFVAVDRYDKTIFEQGKSLVQYARNRYSIVIYLLKSSCDSSFRAALKYGSAYLLKPFSSELFLESIHFYAKYAQIHFLQREKNNKLIEYKKIIDRENALAESIFSKQFKQHLIQSDFIRHYLSSASVFNGDVLLTAQGPGSYIYIAVGDVTGHGLAAAIGAMPVYATFRTMAKKGFAIGSIAAEMNKTLLELLPDTMMMALTIMRLDYITGKATLWSGGMPEIIIVNDKGQVVRQIMSRHSPLAMLDVKNFKQDVDLIELDNNDRVFLYTDGIEESTNEKGELLGADHLHSLFSGPSELIFDKIIQAHKTYIGQNKQDDDITLVELNYHKGINILPLEKAKNIPKINSNPWEMSFSISVNEIKNSDPLAHIMSIVNGAIANSDDQDFIATLLTELFNNALDHGLLQLDSSIKATPDGFIDYYINRRKKISQLEGGVIKFDLQYRHDDDNVPQLIISVEDTGKGFDYKTLLNKKNNINKAETYGNGLSLLMSIANKVEFSHSGKKVRVLYLLNQV